MSETLHATWPPRGMHRERVEVLGSFMACVVSDQPAAETLVFLHGNPTSSYLWRHVLVELATSYHCVAVDLIGMGRSGKPPIIYDYADHLRHLDALLDAMSLGPIVVVGHDWGGVLGLDLARRRPDTVRGVAFCESHWMPWPDFDEVDADTRTMFEPLRTPGTRERILLEENAFIEAVLPGGMDRVLDDDDWAHYREPYPTPESRRPILAWVQQIPIKGEPQAVDEAVRANAAGLKSGMIRGLALVADPGSVVSADAVREIASCPAVTVRHVGHGTHFVPEDCGETIAEAIDTWMSTFR